MAKSWYQIQNKANNAAEILIYDEIGYWDINAKDLARDLKDIGNVSNIDVRINSPGGSVFDGTAIYNLLKNHNAEVTVYIDGLAASIASVIAMAGDKIVMAENALMMIHNPWSGVWGEADDMRKEAEVLDKIKDSIIATYVSRTGKTADELSAMMDEETWLDATEAVELGFADETTEPRLEAAKFNPETVNSLPEKYRAKFNAAPVAPKEQEPMPKKEELQEPVNVEQVQKDAVKAALKAETERRASIKGAFGKFSGDHADLLAASLDDVECSVETARENLLAELGKAETPVNKNVVIVADEKDKFGEGVSNALMARAGLAKDDAKNEFRGHTLGELARASLERSGVNTSRMDKRTLASNAFTHTSSDFGSLLANVAEKAMLKGYEEAEETFKLWTSKGTLSDFKATSRVDLNTFPSLDSVGDGEEYNYGTTGDRGETIQLATYGKMFAITRQTIINDDLSAFTRIPQRMGRAAIRTIGNLVYAVLTANPAMSDGTALFHADHGNLGTGAITTASLDALRVKMALQKEGEATLNVTPSYLIVPAALQGVAISAIESETEMAANQANSKRPNYCRNMAQVISDARLDASSSAAFYMAANPAMFDGIEVAYLDGNETPFLDQQNGWNVDGTEFKVRIDAGVKALDFKTLAKSTGA